MFLTTAYKPLTKYPGLEGSVVDRHRFDADPDPDPNFHVDASQGPDSDPDWHQNYAVPHANPTPSFTHVGKCDFFYF